MRNTNLSHAVNDNITSAQFLEFLFICFHYANRSIDISQYFVFGIQILISKFHLNYIVFKKILRDMSSFQVIHFNLSKTESNHN